MLVTTGGYIGDTPPVPRACRRESARATGAIVWVFNSLCSDRHELIVPSSCSASDSAIWARSGAVVDPETGNILVATGNGPWNGSTNWGDSVLELSPDGSRLLQNWTPTDQKRLEDADVDLGSTAPALLGNGLALQSGKDGKLRLLDLRRLNGRTRTAGPITGGELQTLPAPGGGGVFTAPAVWRSADTTWVFVATFERHRRVQARRARHIVRIWENDTGGTSPVVAGGLLFVYARRAADLPPGLAATDRDARQRAPVTGTARSWPTAGSRFPRATRTSIAPTACSTSGLSRVREIVPRRYAPDVKIEIYYCPV